jgi:hypothetical protein
MNKKKNPTAPVTGQVGVAFASGQAMAPQQYVPVVPTMVPPLAQSTLRVLDAPVSDNVIGKPKKGVRCWKCAATLIHQKNARKFSNVWFVTMISAHTLSYLEASKATWVFCWLWR